jgi:hypothetical protein
VSVSVVSAIMLGLLTEHFAGYEPDYVISLSGLYYPITIAADGASLLSMGMFGDGGEAEFGREN